MAHGPDLATASGRSELATKMAHVCIALLPELPLAEMLCLVMDDADRLARLVGQHIARSVGEAYEEHDPSQVHSRPAPLALVLELRDKLGERVVRRLEAPIPPRSMRVLWLTPSHHHVLDVPIDTQTLLQTRETLESARLRDEFELDDEDDAGAEGRVWHVGGTWRDPMLYMPMPLPAGWITDGIDRLGVLHVILEDRIRFTVGAMEPEQGKCLFVIFEKLIGGRHVTDEEARAVLDRLHNVRRFGELEDMEELFGDNRAFAAPIVEGPALGSG